MRQMGIDEFFRARRSLGIKKDDLSGETLKYKYTKHAPYKVNNHFSQASNKKKSSSLFQSSFQEGQRYVHKPPGRHSNILYVY